MFQKTAILLVCSFFILPGCSQKLSTTFLRTFSSLESINFEETDYFAVHIHADLELDLKLAELSDFQKSLSYNLKPSALAYNDRPTSEKVIGLSHIDSLFNSYICDSEPNKFVKDPQVSYLFDATDMSKTEYDFFDNGLLN